MNDSSSLDSSTLYLVVFSGFKSKHRMRSVDLLVDGRGIYTSRVNRTLYTLYRSKSSLFPRMLVDQGTDYWIKFVTTLREVLDHEGYGIQYVKCDVNHIQEFFIKLVDMLTSDNPETVRNLIIDVVRVARFSELFNDAHFYGCKDSENTPCESLIALFGEDFHNKMWTLFPLFLRTVGSLLKIFELWLSAKPTKTIQWKPPNNWHSSESSVSREYEIHLRNVWNDKLLSMLGINKENEICWWKDMCSLDVEGVILRRKVSTLGRAIITVIIKSMANIQSSVGSLKSLNWLSESGSQLNSLYTHHILKNFPRGASMVFSQDNYLLLFIAACSREVYLTSDIEAFHPYTQFKFCFWNMMYGPHFWEAMSNCSLDSPPLSQKEIFFKSTSKGDVQATISTTSGRKHNKNKGFEKYLEIEILRPLTSVSEIRTAISLDSHFHDSLACQTSWTSPETVVRLLWNMPLCLNWLEILLLRIYEFESQFLPFVHTPLRLNVKKLAEELYVNYCKAARFLVKSAIIVAEYIYLNEVNHFGKCYDARISLKSAISSLVPKMEFLSGPCYQILEVIIRENTVEDKVKQESSAFCDIKIFPDLSCACIIPDMDHIFSSDRRSVNYWISRTKKTPALQESLRFVVECVKALQEYEKHVLNKHSCEKNKCNKMSKHLYVYDKKTYLDTCVDYFSLKHTCSLQQEIAFIMEMFDLLKEDQLIEEPIIIKDLCAKLIYTGISCNDGTGSGTSKRDYEEEKKLVFELAHLGRVYLTCSSFCGFLSPNETAIIPDQILLTRLISAECRSAMADAASRFIVISHQLHQFESKPSPSKRVFEEANRTIASYNQKQLTLSEAVDLLFNVQRCYSIDTTAIIPLKVPRLKGDTDKTENKDPLCLKDYQVYLDELCSLRYSLLYEVSEKQLYNVQITSQTTKMYENVFFPYQHVLEYRFVEEMAALRKCLAIGGDKCKTTANRLAILLYHRAGWMIEKYKLWSKAVVSPIEKKFEVSPNLVQIAVSTRVQIAALLISLQSIFIVYLSDYKTVHPISQSNMDILVEWQSFNIKFLNGPKTFMIDKMKEYYDTLRIMGIEYLTDLLEHCTSTWAVPQLCCNPTQDVELLSLQHAEKIYSALLQFSLLCSYGLLTSNISSGMEFTLNISYKLVKAEVLLRSAGVDSSVDWNDSYNKVKAIFEDIICTLHLVEDISFTEKPSWRGCNDIYLVLFKSFISLERDGLKCLHLNEFLENSLDWGSAEEEETDQTNSKENSKSESERKHHYKVRKLTKIVCSKHNVSKTLVIKKTVIKSVKHSKNCPIAHKSGDERENCSHSENSSAEMKRLKRKAKKERYMLNKKTKDKGNVEKTVNDKDISHEKCEGKGNKTTDTSEDRNVSALTTGEKIVKKKKKSKLSCLENKRELPLKGTLSKERLVGKKEVRNDEKSIEHRKRKLQENKVDKLLSNQKIDNKVKSNLEDCTSVTDVQIMKDDKDITRAENDLTKLASSKVVKDKTDYIEVTFLNNNKQEQIKIKPEEVTKEQGELQSLITNIEDMINKPEEEIATAGKTMLESVAAGTSFFKLCTEIACDAKLTNRGETEKNSVKATSNNSTVIDNEKQNVGTYEREDDDSGKTKDGKKNLHSQNLKRCFNCGNTEAVRRTFKKCSLCEKYKWKVKRFYCSPECQAKDWKALHCQEHKTGLVQ